MHILVYHREGILRTALRCEYRESTDKGVLHAETRILGIYMLIIPVSRYASIVTLSSGERGGVVTFEQLAVKFKRARDFRLRLNLCYTELEIVRPNQKAYGTVETRHLLIINLCPKTHRFRDTYSRVFI